MYHYELTKSWIGVNQISLKDIERLSVFASPVNIFQVVPFAGSFQHYAWLFPTLKGRQEVWIRPLKRNTTGLTLPIYRKDPPNPFESDGSVEGEEMEEMVDEAMTILNEVNPFQYNSIRLERLLNMQSGSLGASVLAALRRTSFLRCLADGMTQDMCQQSMLTGISSGLLHLNLKSVMRCTSFIVTCTFCPGLSEEATGGGSMRFLPFFTGDRQGSVGGVIASKFNCFFSVGKFN